MLMMITKLFAQVYGRFVKFKGFYAAPEPCAQINEILTQTN